jgi:hypothetical protein
MKRRGPNLEASRCFDCFRSLDVRWMRHLRGSMLCRGHRSERWHRFRGR